MEGEIWSTFTDGTCEKRLCSPSLHFFVIYGIDDMSYQQILMGCMVSKRRGMSHQRKWKTFQDTEALQELQAQVGLNWAIGGYNEGKTEMIVHLEEAS